MAFSKVFLSKNLQLKLNTGLDENFNPIYKTRTWANVKANATDEDLFELFPASTCDGRPAIRHPSCNRRRLRTNHIHNLRKEGKPLWRQLKC